MNVLRQLVKVVVDLENDEKEIREYQAGRAEIQAPASKKEGCQTVQRRR